MAAMAGDNQGSGKWLADYIDHCRRGRVIDEGIGWSLIWVEDIRGASTRTGQSHNAHLGHSFGGISNVALWRRKEGWRACSRRCTHMGYRSMGCIPCEMHAYGGG